MAPTAHLPLFTGMVNRCEDTPVPILVACSTWPTPLASATWTAKDDHHNLAREAPNSVSVHTEGEDVVKTQGKFSLKITNSL